jgi:hypothetical protein
MILFQLCGSNLEVVENPAHLSNRWLMLAAYHRVPEFAQNAVSGAVVDVYIGAIQVA